MPILIRAHVLAPWTIRLKIAWVLLKFIVVMLLPWHEGADLEIVTAQ